MKVRLGLALAATLTTFAFAAQAGAAPIGSLQQLGGTDACITSNDASTQGCAFSPALSDPFPMAQSPDGRQIYAGGNSFGSDAAFGAFARGSRGALSAIGGSCFLEEGTSAAGCTEQRGLRMLGDIKVSPDGKHVYVLALGAPFDAGDTTITTYSRDAGTGALTPVAGADGCIASGAVTGCNTVEEIEDGARLAFNPGNEHLYVASNGSPGAVITLNRDASNGTLSALGGDAGCVHDAAATADCRAGHHLASVNNLVVNDIGTRLYVAGGEANGTIVSLPIAQDGTVSQTTDPGACFTGGTATSNCSHGRGLATAWVFGSANPYGLVLSPDGDSLYVSGDGMNETTITVFGTHPSGSLIQPGGEEGCVDIDDTEPDEDCAEGRGLTGVFDLAMSPDSKTLYTAAYRGLGNAGGVGVYDVGFDGTSLVQQPGADGCLTSGSGQGCQEGIRGMYGAASVIVSNDGENVYVGALDDAAIAAFSRQVAPTCSDSTAVVTAGIPAQLPASCRDANGETLAFTVTGQPQHGAVSGGGALTYTAAAGYNGSDSVTFRASDGEHVSGEATITVDVRKPNAISIASRGALKPDKKGNVAISLLCQGNAPAACSGELRLSTRLKGKKKPLTAGRAGYSLAGGETKAVLVRLTGKVKKALAKGSLKATAGAFPGDGSAPVTAPVKLKKSAKKAAKK